MKIEQIEITKFRSIKHAKIIMHDITAIVGENNAGKTAILRALNAVMNYEQEKDAFASYRHQFAPKCNSKICIAFSDVPSVFSDKTFNNNLTIEFIYKYGSHKEFFTVIKGRDSRERIDSSFMNDLATHIKYVYIPSERTNKDISWDKDSIFKQLVLSYVAQHTENRDTLSTPVRHATNKIHDSALVKLERTINGLYMQNKDVDFQISFPQDIDYSILLDKATFSLKEYGRNLPLQEWGSGTKSLAIIAIHRAFALLHKTSIVLGIEEPEVNLHPQAQKKFIMSLRDNRHINETQSIFTTHSTVLVDSLKHEEIVLVRRISDERGFVSVTHQISNNFWTLHNIEEFKHYQYFIYKNSDFFFSKYVVIAESKNDCQIIEHLVTPAIKNYAADVSYLDAGGTGSLIYPYFLLKELCIPFTMVVDKDYLFNYRDNNDLERSRDPKTGLPLYSHILNRTQIIEDLFPLETEKQRIEESSKTGYRALFSVIKERDLVCMHFNLETDLVCSKQARNIYYKTLRIPPVNQSQLFLLKNCKDGIKKSSTIIPIVKSLPLNAMPESFCKIKNHIIGRINDSLS